MLIEEIAENKDGKYSEYFKDNNIYTLAELIRSQAPELLPQELESSDVPDFLFDLNRKYLRNLPLKIEEDGFQCLYNNVSNIEAYNVLLVNFATDWSDYERELSISHYRSQLENNDPFTVTNADKEKWAKEDLDKKTVPNIPEKTVNNDPHDEP